MDTVPKPETPRRGQRAWTDAQRADQARKIREHKVWTYSTGPRTPFGKSTSSRNSYKHGRFSYERKVIRWYTRFAALRLKKIRTHLHNQNYKRENELRDKYGIPMSKRPDTMAFYPYFKVHPIYAKKNRVRKPRQKSEQQEIFDYFTSLSGED